MRIPALFNVVASAASALGCFVLVHSAGQGWISLALRAAAALIAMCASLAIAWHGVPFVRPNWDWIWQVISSGKSLFVFKSALSFYTTANVLLLGALAPANVVGWYAGAEKISRAALSLASPISQAFYPRITHLLSNDKKQASRTIALASWLTLAIGALTGAAMVLGAPLVVRLLLGPNFRQSIPVLRVFGALPLIIAASTVLGPQWMLPLRMDREFSFAIIAAGLVNLLLSAILVRPFQQLGMASSVVLSEAIVPFALLILLHRRQLLPWVYLRAVSAPA